jgi:hypothetical protein
VGDLLENLKLLLGKEDDNENPLLTLFLTKASKVVAKRRYPFGYEDAQYQILLSQYDDVILDVAVYLYNKQGAEGETSHSENGVGRSYESAGVPESYLDGIVPCCKCF